MNIIYTFNKSGEEGKVWENAIRSASNTCHVFFPFNRSGYGDAHLYSNAVKLDRMYQRRDQRLIALYADFEAAIRECAAEAVVVIDTPPFHPDYLRSLPIYKVLYSHDDPESSYERNIPYLHAYQHVWYCTPAYTDDMDMSEKMEYCGMKNHDLVPMGVFDDDFDQGLSEQELFSQPRNIPVLYVGSFYWRKISLLAELKKALGQSFVWRGRLYIKHNVYLTAKYRYPFWVMPVSPSERLALHQRAKICINVHNGYAVPNFGNQRLFIGAANGSLVLSDGKRHMNHFFEEGREMVSYEDFDDLLRKIQYYLANDEERERIARAGYRRVMRDYRFADITRRCADKIEQGIRRTCWNLSHKGPERSHD